MTLNVYECTFPDVVVHVEGLLEEEGEFRVLSFDIRVDNRDLEVKRENPEDRLVLAQPFWVKLVFAIFAEDGSELHRDFVFVGNRSEELVEVPAPDCPNFDQRLAWSNVWKC